MACVKETVGFLANRAAWKYRFMLNQVIAPCGYDITVEHWIVLYALYQNDQISQIELARATYKDRANVTRLIQKLEVCHLVKRIRAPGDQRSFVVSLTKEGQALVKKLRPKLKAVTDAVNVHFGEKRVARLQKDLLELCDFVDGISAEELWK